MTVYSETTQRACKLHTERPWPDDVFKPRTSHSPETCIRLTGVSKLVVGVNISMGPHLSHCVGPVRLQSSHSLNWISGGELIDELSKFTSLVQH